MSDQPTDIVFAALKQMQANGVHLRGSLDTCERLRATATASGPIRTASRAPQPAAAVPAAGETRSRPESAPKIEFPTASEPARRESFAPAATSASSGKSAQLDALRGPVLACTKCPHLVQSRTQVVFGVGNPDAEVMFISDAPGAEEDIVGEPFVGKPGQTLTKIIEAMSFRRPDVYISNVLKCRPNPRPGDSEDRKPTPAEIHVCKPYLLRQIEIIQPKVIVALGGGAVEALLGIDNAGIAKMRGTWKEFMGIPMMPTFHPAYLVHNQSNAEKRKVWEDMLAVLERLGHGITARQRGFFLTK